MVSVLDNKLWFPHESQAMEDGLLAIGGDLSPERLILAYKNGIFPWFDGHIPVWWNPDPRFVLFPENLYISKSMQKVLQGNEFEFKINTAFEEVITNCQKVKRKEQDGTWITDEVLNAYVQLHKMNIAHSAEAWHQGKLVGGLYGIRMGNVFFGESMFAEKSNASKFAFIKYIQKLKAEGVVLIDCQVYTLHLESLGAAMIPRGEFMKLLRDNVIM